MTDTDYSFKQSDSKTETTYSFQTDSEEDTGGGSSFPTRLKKFDQWLVTHDTPWNTERHKSPRYPASGWNDGNLIPFDEAYQRHQQANRTGIAFCFTEDSPFIGFDLDDVKQDGEFTAEALGIVQQLASYTEVSGSGDGLHVIAEGQKAEDRQTRAELSEGGHTEVYEQDRYFVLTANVHEGYSTVETRPTAVRAVQEHYLPEEKTWSFKHQQTPTDSQQSGHKRTDATPEQVRRTLEAYERDDVIRLWEGNNCGYRSLSEADLAFVSHLAFWCKEDRQLMDECVRVSDRMREKWDEIHSADGKTYGEMTIATAYQSNDDTFGGTYVE